MIALGFGVMWLGYLQAVYGFTLLKGWDIPWHLLANPINPYQWPASGSPPLIAKGSVMPSGGTSTTAASSSSGGTAGMT